MRIAELSDVDTLKRWELLYEDVHLVLLNDTAPLPFRSELFAFDASTLNLLWKLTPDRPEEDSIMSVWIRDGNLFAASWSCLTYCLDRRTGAVLDRKFTK